MAAGEFRSAHPLFAFELNFAQTQRTASARDDYFVRRDAVLTDNFGGKNLEFPFAAVANSHCRVGARPRIVGADLPLDHFGWLRPIDPAMFAFELRRIRRLRIVLRNARRSSICELS